MKFILIILTLFVSVHSFGQADSWATSLKIETAQATQRTDYSNAFRTGSMIIMLLCCAGFGLNKIKAKHYEKINKGGSGSVGTMDKMWTANKNCVGFALAATAGMVMWYIGDGPVPVIEFIKHHL